MRTVHVKASEIAKAIARAESVSDDWQAANLEILCIPSVRRRWRAINRRFPDLQIVRHTGRAHKGMSREDNIKAYWPEFAGYSLQYGALSDGNAWGWNSKARDERDGYSHSASATWDGARRETRCSFCDGLRYSYLAAIGEIKINDRVRSWMEPYGIAFVDDLESASL